MTVKEVEINPALVKEEKETKIVPSAHACSLEILDELRTLFVNYTQELSARVNHAKSRENLKNATCHWTALFASLKHLLNQNESISKEAFLAIFLNSLRNGSLLVEQMLTAFECETLSLEEGGKSSRQSTHDYRIALIRCGEKRGLLSEKCRAILLEINGLEIASRHLDATLCSNPFSKHLILSLNFFIQRNLYQKELQEKLPLFLQKVIFASTEICRTLFVMHELEFSLDKEEVLCQLYLDIQKKLATLPVLEATHNRSALRILCESFKNESDSSYIRGRSDNLLNNLLVQLEWEMHVQQQLIPIDAYRHMGSTLLLTQMVAEEVLELILKIRHIQKDSSVLEHDLFHILEQTGVNLDSLKLTNQESAFLHKSRSIRFDARYVREEASKAPAASKKRKRTRGGKKKSTYYEDIRKALGRARFLSQEALFTDDNKLDEGFTVSSKQLALVKQISHESVELLQALIKKVFIAVEKSDDLH